MMPRRGAGDAAATPNAPLNGEHFCNLARDGLTSRPGSRAALP
jgi:hypothetical protein